MLRTCLICLIMASVALPAVSVDELVAAVVEEIPADELREPGSSVLAQRLATLADEDLGLDRSAHHDLRLRVVEAWIDAGHPDRATAALEPLLDDLTPGSPLHIRAGLALLAAWELRLLRSEDPSAVPDASQALGADRGFAAEVQARAGALDAQRALDAGDPDAAMRHLDRALDLLADAPPRSRVPLYALRVLAMEMAAIDPAAMTAWFDARDDDPAVAMVRADLLTDGQRLVGQAAPALEIPYLDRDGVWRFDPTPRDGAQPVLLYFFTTWSEACVPVTEAVAGIDRAREGVTVVGISLDTRDTVGFLGDYIARYDIGFPIVGAGLGWDGEADDLLHVDGIPHLVLIGADRRIEAIGLVGDDRPATTRRIDAALDGLRDTDTTDDRHQEQIP